MNKILFMLISICTLALVSATVLEVVAINQDVIDATGALIGPRTSLSGASVEGYLCGDATCSFTTGAFLPSTSIPGSSITLSYPTTLTSPFGYALYYTAPGYIPFEVRSTYAGTGSVVGEAILTKKQTCTFPLTLATIANTTQTTITGTLSSPIAHAGPLPVVPASLLTHYQVTGTLSLALTNSTFSNTTTQTKTLSFSEIQPFTIVTSAPNGTYTYTLSASSTDAKCLATTATLSTGTITLGTLGSTNTTTGTNSTNTTPTITIISPQALTYTNATILINISATNASTITAGIPGFLSTTYTAPFTIALPDGTYTLTATASNNTQLATANITFTINTSSTGTNTTNGTTNLPPATVANLNATVHTPTSITWNWTNPTDPDFSHVQLSLNNLFIGNSSGTSYVATGLLPNTTYTLSLTTVDNASIINTTAITNTTRTLLGLGGNSSGGSGGNGNTTNPGNSSLGIPGGVLNLQAIARTNTSITWNWTSPSANFSHVSVYLNGLFQLNTSNTTFTSPTLIPDTAYTLSLFTHNASGATSGIPVVNTTRTLPNAITPQNQTQQDANKKKAKEKESERYTYTTSTPRTTSTLLQLNESTTLNLTQPVTTELPLKFILLLLTLLVITLAMILYALTATTGSKKPYKMPGF
jgi:hypothetical protein